ncbi:MAG: ABC transporter ATP-binding protein [Bacteroidales bacterium]|nr:ABC transporter ATP-binding protein [Bacteroidales bacterium]
MLSIKNLSVNLNNFNLTNINLEIEKGDYFLLAGPSGSGKTILLEAIAGIHEKNTSGQISLNNRDIRKRKIQDRNVGLVFQDNTLFPHLSVRKNIHFALNQRGKKSGIHLFKDICRQLFLDELLDRDPKTLSGGEIQRVLLARTLASEPEIILLDEPLTGVDTNQKDLLKSMLRNLNRSGQTIIHVTHDFEEAMSLANKMGIMHNGQIAQLGTPKEILEKPRNKFVARFCGYKNYFPAIAESTGKILVANKIHLKHHLETAIQEICSILLDETKIEIYREAGRNNQTNLFKGKISDLFPSAKGWEVEIDIGVKLSAIVKSNNQESKPIEIGDVLWVGIPDSSIHIILK